MQNRLYKNLIVILDICQLSKDYRNCQLNIEIFQNFLQEHDMENYE